LRIRGPRGYLLLASHADALLTSSVLGWIGDQPLIEIAVGCGYGVSAVVKRTIDIVVSALLVAFTAPLWILAAAAIWLEDRGPVTLRQERVGRGGVPFAMWKFRSMRDERVTRVSALLRRYRIDELRSWSTLTGDMSSSIASAAADRRASDRGAGLICAARAAQIAGLAQVSSNMKRIGEIAI
jgi:lipopolysaccharide/colanic/teichoic acid biosynthesis glycosyltransferase